MDTLLSKAPLDVNDPGYQEPVPKDEPFATSQKANSGAASGGAQTRPNEKKERGEKDREGGKGRRRGAKMYNPPMKGEEAKPAEQTETKDAEKKTGKDKGSKGGKQDHDDKKKEKKADKGGADAKEGKGDKEKGGRGRRSRKEKLNAPAVKDDEVQPGKKAKQERQQRNRDRRQGGGMMQPDLYGPGPRGMPMGPGNPDARGPHPYNLPPMDRGYGQGGHRQRDHPRTVPPYMGYPGGGRSYDDTYLRPQRGHKGNRRGPPQMDLPYRRPMDHNPMYNYPPYGYD